jgi:lipopolysaccharide assembly outer membrane protein LptD (OstA)
MNRSTYLTFLLLTSLAMADDRLYLVRADVLENIIINNVATQILTGNVEFKRGEITLTCDRARFVEKTGLGYLIGNATVQKKDLTVVADSMNYDSPSNLLRGYGNVKAWDDDYTINADSLYYYTEIDSGIAMSNVHMNQDPQSLSADKVIYSKPPSTDQASYWATGKVVMQDEDITTRSDEADYSAEKETAFLRGTPQIKERNRTLYGKEIKIQNREGKLHYVLIPDSARVTALHKRINTGMRSGPDEYADDMTGSIMHAYFQDGAMDSVRLEGMATTIYHVFEDSLFQGINEASGDTMQLLFKNDELDQIKVSGGARGTFTPDSAHASITAPIDYESDKIDYKIPTEMTDLQGEARIKYEDIDLTAGYIGVHWTTNLLSAYSSLGSDTSQTAIRPKLIEAGREPLLGDTMYYNLKTQKGRVTRGQTKAEDGYYRGSVIRNDQQDIFYVNSSTYTTCDLDEPHFHFDSQRMKMIHNDKVVAKPLILYLGGIPIFGIPFAVLPHRGGARHSGWIMPGYGENRARGQYIDGLGYYWAPSQYFDSRFLIGFADRQGVTTKSTTRYKKRYKFDGNLHIEARRLLGANETNITRLTENYKTDYVFKWDHRQTMRYNQMFNVNASYYSNSEYNYTVELDPVKRMNQQAISNATYSKRWPKSNNSLSINLSSNRDLMVAKKIDPGSDFYQRPATEGTKLNISTNTLPKLSFRHGQSPLIPTKSSHKNWYHNISWSYSSNFTNKNQTFYQSARDDTLNQFIWLNDDSGNGRVFSSTNNLLTHSISMSAPQKIFRYISINPSLSLKSDWVQKTFDGSLDSSGNVITERKDGLAIRTTGSFSVNAKTQVYGLIPVQIGALRSIRHVISPSLGYTYTPDFSKPVFGWDPGYVVDLESPEGEIVKHDRFRNTMAGGTPQSERQSLNASVNNVFQAKVGEGENEKKVDLLSWQMSTNYNFAAEEFQLSNLSSSLRTKLAKVLNLDLSMTHDFYKYDKENNRRLNSFQLSSSGIPTPRLINARLSTGFQFEGKRFKGLSQSVADTSSVADTLTFSELDDFGQTNQLERVAKPLEGDQLWSSNLNLSYSYNNVNPTNPIKTLWLNSNTSVQLTANWRVQHNARFDLIEKSMVSNSFTIYRDLHCWEMSISWTPGGYGKGFYLKINVKSPALKDLKIEEKSGFFQSRALF